MIKKKVSDSIYQIYVEKYPDTVEESVYRGDSYSFTIIGFNFDDTPFDWNVYDTFNAQIRLGSPKNKKFVYEFPASSFILGKTSLENDEQDELHVVDDEAMNFSKPYNKAWLDIQGSIGDEKKTFIRVKLNIESDVTR